MSDIESSPENEERSTKWGFLEDMASIGRLDMVLGDMALGDAEEEEQPPVPEDALQE